MIITVTESHKSADMHTAIYDMQIISMIHEYSGLNCFWVTGLSISLLSQWSPIRAIVKSTSALGLQGYLNTMSLENKAFPAV